MLCWRERRVGCLGVVVSATGRSWMSPNFEHGRRRSCVSSRGSRTPLLGETRAATDKAHFGTINTYSMRIHTPKNEFGATKVSVRIF